MREKTPNTLRTLRRQKRLTLAAVAAALGANAKTVWNWENGVHAPSKERIDLLARLYGVEPDSIAAMFPAPDSTAAV